MTDNVRRHLELYHELCEKLNGPLESWDVNDDVMLDHIVNESGMDEVRVIIHNCYDGDGYFWSCGGWYRRDALLDEKRGKTVYGPWELETAWHFGGDGGPRMRIFWQNEDGLLEDDV